MKSKVKWIGSGALIALLAVKAYAYTTTINMSLKIPASGDTDYPTSISDSFTLIDAHDHTSGKGVQIPAGGIATDAVTNAKMANNAVNTAEIVDLAVTTAKINDGAVTTAKINDGAVTAAKLAASTYVRSANCSIHASTSTSYVDISNLSVSFTSTGRPAIIAMIPTDGSIGSSVSTENVTPGASGGVKFLYNGTDINDIRFLTLATEISLPPGTFWTFWVPPAAGVYTIKAQFKAGISCTIVVQETTLVVYQL